MSCFERNELHYKYLAKKLEVEKIEIINFQNRWEPVLDSSRIIFNCIIDFNKISNLKNILKSANVEITDLDYDARIRTLKIKLEINENYR